MEFQKIVHRAVDLHRQYEIKETDVNLETAFMEAMDRLETHLLEAK